MTTQSPSKRTTDTEPSAFRFAAWIVGAVCLTLLLNLALTLTQNQFFFIAHDSQPWQVALILAGAIVALTVVLWIAFSLLGRIAQESARRNWQFALAWLLLLAISANLVRRNAPALNSALPGIPTGALVVGTTLFTLILLASFLSLRLLWLDPYAKLMASASVMIKALDQRNRLFLAAGWLVLTLALVGAVSGILGTLGEVLLQSLLAAGISTVALISIVKIRASVAVLLIAAFTSLAPLLQLQFEYESADPVNVTTEIPLTTPDVLWVVVDELQYPVLFDDQGRVRENFPNLRSFQDTATTYTDAYTPATFTDIAIPAILNGVSQLNERSDDELREMQRGRGVLEVVGGDYALSTFSEFFNGSGRDQIASSTGALNLGETGLNPLETRDMDARGGLPLLAADTLAVLGATALASPLSQVFPSLEGQWTNFWNPSEARVASADPTSLAQRLQETKRPTFAFWHDMSVHSPQTIDFNGKVLPRADLGTSQYASSGSSSLAELHRRLYLAEVEEMDRQFGSLMEAADERKNAEGLLIIFTADHGRTFTSGDVRYGDSSEEAWGEVAHVPLMVRYPFQETPATVNGIRSVGQIVPTIYEVLGISPESAFLDSPPLDQELPLPPIPYGWEASTRDEWCSTDCRRDSDAFWSQETLMAAEATNPWAVGLDPAEIGNVIAADATPLRVNDVEITRGGEMATTHLTLTSNSLCARSNDHAVVTADGVIVGSILWEDSDGSKEAVRGWGLLPGSVDTSGIAFYCAS